MGNRLGGLASVPTAVASEAKERVDVDPFVADIARMVLTFFVVVAIDLVFVSLFTQRLRFWFPSWLDP